MLVHGEVCRTRLLLKASRGWRVNVRGRKTSMECYANPETRSLCVAETNADKWNDDCMLLCYHSHGCFAPAGPDYRSDSASASSSAQVLVQTGSANLNVCRWGSILAARGPCWEHLQPRTFTLTQRGGRSPNWAPSANQREARSLPGGAEPSPSPAAPPPTFMDQLATPESRITWGIVPKSVFASHGRVAQ